ncbi:hypothetical protein [Nocardia sp. CA-119907]|uniref:hypothetical protein n=1 Tax=Nocardia sp. CA-119907 TaxID=3239973 RepID=UPI003D99C601
MAIDARRAATDTLLERVRNVLGQIKRERAKDSFASVARRADVSRTFLYQNPDARNLVEQAAEAAETNRSHERTTHSAQVEASWHERALNAEEALTAAYREIAQQRTAIGELLGRIRDLEGALPEDGVQRLITENTTLKKQVNQLNQDNRRLQDRLQGARDNNRFLDNRIAQLEAQPIDGAADQDFPSGSTLIRFTGPPATLVGDSRHG